MIRLLPRVGINRISVETRAPNPARSGLAIVLIARNEAAHIGEWAAFHRAAGVQHIFFYDNGSTDGTAEVLRRAAGNDHVTVLPWSQFLTNSRTGSELNNQVFAYAHAVQNFGAPFRWFAAIDADEFLVPVARPTLPEILEAYPDQHLLTLPWVNFGRSGHMTPPDGGIVPNYTRRARTGSDNAYVRSKCIFDPAFVAVLGVHDMQMREGSAELAVGPEVIQFNHYYTRSDAELRAKIRRGPMLKLRTPKHERRVLRRVAAIEADEVEDQIAREWWKNRQTSAENQK